MDKLTRYNNLIAKFKNYKFKNIQLLNPHDVEGFNFEVINPWELWYNNLNAEILFIGQDFSDSSSLIENLKSDWRKEKKGQTNKSLILLFKSLGYDLNNVNYDNNSQDLLFFTNAILGIKKSETGNMSKSVKENWWVETKEYLGELIDIIQPKYIIAMGKVAHKAVWVIHNQKVQNDIISNPIELPDGKVLFAVQHCSPRGKITRNFETQIQDWAKIKQAISNNASSKYLQFQEEIATRKTWKNIRIDKPQRIDILLCYDNSQFPKLTKGSIPKEMEDKWFIFYEDGWLYFHRSWSGYGIYKAPLIKENGRYYIKEFWVERNFKKYQFVNDEDDIHGITNIIKSRLIGGS